MTAKHVDPGYSHVAKQISPGPALTCGSSRLKWYCLAKADTPVEPEVKVLAQDFLQRAATRPEWPLDDDVGFVILHRCGADFYFLILCSWRNDNELWETVYFKADAKTPDFGLFPQSAHKGTYCVWESGVVEYEVKAWTRFLKSNRDGGAMRDYLSGYASGEVG